MVSDALVATVVTVVVAASFPCFLYGAWIMLDSDEVTWGVLIHHLKFILVGLTLTTVPLVLWMFPRLLEQFGGPAAAHAFFGLQAYAFLAFGLTGIVRVFWAKYEHDLYSEYDEDVVLDEIGDENMRFWRRRIRVGVFGYTVCWLVAFLTGFVRYLSMYVFT